MLFEGVLYCAWDLENDKSKVPSRSSCWVSSWLGVWTAQGLFSRWGSFIYGWKYFWSITWLESILWWSGLVSESDQQYPIAAKLQFNFTNNMAEWTFHSLFENGHWHECLWVAGYWRSKFADLSSLRRMGIEEPEDHTICAIYTEDV